MPDMYDKLGEMLNNVLESGKIPTDHSDADNIRHCEANNLRHCEAEGRSKQHKNNNDQTIDEKTHESGHFSFNNTEKTTVNNKKSAKKDSKKAFSTGEVIKLHKYTYNMQFPPQIQKALYTLDIAHSFTTKDISKQYHKLLKENHPDTKKTIQTSKDVQNTRQYTIDEITEAYKILCSFFSIK